MGILCWKVEEPSSRLLLWSVVLSWLLLRRWPTHLGSTTPILTRGSSQPATATPLVQATMATKDMGPTPATPLAIPDITLDMTTPATMATLDIMLDIILDPTSPSGMRPMEDI